MAWVASPKEALEARLKEKVMTGNCPWWLTASGAVFCSKCAKALSGTAAPFTLGIGGGLAAPDVAFAAGPDGLELEEAAPPAPAVITGLELVAAGVPTTE